MERMVTLNKREQTRLRVLNEVEKGVLVGLQAATLLGLSLRHTRRLLAAYREFGAAGLAHGNRGRRPSNTIADEIRCTVVSLANGKYAGFNQQHFTDMLSERHDICISRGTVRNILLAHGLGSPRPRQVPRHRSRRERYAQEGMLLQIDSSPHHWLEERGPAMSLVGAIDDATGKVPYALFREQEDTTGYFILMQEIVVRHGIPLAVYRDRHSIFEVSEQKAPSLEEQLEGKEPLTQFGRLLSELGIESIPALSPQAKGRVERLWGTFQDRLVSELRLESVATIAQANQFLPSFLERYNAHFAVPAAIPGSAYRPLFDDLSLDYLFCLKHQRTVGLDNVVRYRGQRLQVLPSPHRFSYARCRVEVHENLSGSLRLYYQGHYLETCPAPAEPVLLRELTPAIPAAAQQAMRTARPASNHPWRRRLLAARH